jgi:hypothetical protein
MRMDYSVQFHIKLVLEAIIRYETFWEMISATALFGVIRYNMGGQDAHPTRVL